MTTVAAAARYLLVVPLICHSNANAQSVSDDCFIDAASRFGVDERLLRAIAKVESNMNAGAVHVNTDGSRDVGVMQINSYHFRELAKYQIDEASLLTRPCVNVAVGAWILAKMILKHGLTWRAVGAYNAGSVPAKEVSRTTYALLISNEIKRSSGQPFKRPASETPTSPAPVRKMLVVE